MANTEGAIGTEFDFGGVKERVVTRDDFSLDKARQVLKDESIVVLGYGVQGPAQSLNLRDNGFKVTVGQRQGSTFEKAAADGWIPSRDLFSIEDSIRRTAGASSRQIQYLLSDAGQKDAWPNIKPLLKRGDALYFSHGFSITYEKLTGVTPPPDVDVILVAPKGSGRSVRRLFLEGRGINASFAIHQDATSRAQERVLATGMAIGSGFLFPTTFEQETFSDLTGERGVLMGEVWGLCQAAYNNLKRQGQSPEEAATHTVEITTQTISRIIGEKGADGLVKDLPDDLLPYFSSAFAVTKEAVESPFEELYGKVTSGVETARVLEANSLPNYRAILEAELDEMDQSEIGKATTALRQKRPLVASVIGNRPDAIMAGALVASFHSQYDLLIRKGHQPSEAFNETVEESTQSLYPLIDENGFPWMYRSCSATAQRGALDWNGRFKEALEPALRSVYEGRYQPAERVRDIILGSEMWRVGATVRSLRPENQRI